jgi:hypothetical protein
MRHRWRGKQRGIAVADWVATGGAKIIAAGDKANAIEVLDNPAKIASRVRS